MREDYKTRKEKVTFLCAKVALSLNSSLSAISTQKGELPESISKREELERSLHKLDKELKETQSERDKARQELSRLKQHLLDKVAFSYLLLNFLITWSYDF